MCPVIRIRRQTRLVEGKVVATRMIRMILTTMILLSSLKNPVGKRVTAAGA